MKTIVNLKDLLVTQIQDLYSVAIEKLRVISLLSDQATSMDLKKIIQQHINETHEEVIRLDCAFDSLHEKAAKEESPFMHCFVDQAMALWNLCAEPSVKDAAIITSLQHMNHYEIASYGSTCSYANELNAYEVAALLHETLEESKYFDKLLSKLAKEKVNRAAAERILVKSKP